VPRGRKPTPTKLKLLRGNPGKRALTDNEPKPAPAIMPAPAHLSEEAQREWDRVVQLLEPLGLFSELDVGALSVYCSAFGRHVEAEEALKQYGAVIMSPNGYPQQSPYVALANRAADQMLKALVEFGMSPSSRARVAAGETGAKDAVDPLEALRKQNEQRRRTG